MTSCKSIPSILVSPNPKVVAAVDWVVTGALGGMLFDFVNTVIR